MNLASERSNFLSLVHFYLISGGARQKRMPHRNQDNTEDDISTGTEPNILQDQFKWTIHNASVNLPALLNDPRLARRETDFFTKTWGQNFEKSEVIPSPYIPHIEAEHFEKYSKRIAMVIIFPFKADLNKIFFS